MNTAAPVTTPVEDLQALLGAEMASVNDLIRERMASRNAPRIPEVTAHLVGAGGKRLRPLLTLAGAHLFGYAGQDHVRLAATVEFIHTATLLHDDVVDESRNRRGRPTANLLWDNKSSVLVGDYLFARAFQLMVETGSIQVLGILSDTAATIAEGEVLQLSAIGNIETTEKTYLEIIRGKTAALFAAATEVGGLVAGASKGEAAALRAYGDCLGMSFQITDDVLDYGGVATRLGKDVGDDFREGKLTLPVIRAIAGGNETERAFWSQAMDGKRADDLTLERAQQVLARTGALESARETANSYAQEARSALEALPDRPLRQILDGLAQFVVARLN